MAFDAGRLSQSGSRRESVLAQGVRETMESLSRMMPGMLDNPLERAVAANAHGGDDGVLDDEEALKWAAVERLPTYDRVRTSLFHDKETGAVKKMDVRQMTPLETSELLNKLLAEAENETNLLLLKMRKRLDKYGTHLLAMALLHVNLECLVFLFCFEVDSEC